MRRNAAVCAAVFAACAAGCMVGPDYESPDGTAAKEILDFENFANSPDWKTAAPADAKPRGDWWETFGDVRLSEYMRRCADDNPDVKSLLFKVEQAAANAGIKRGVLYPNAGVGADWFKTEFGDRSLFTPLGGRFEDWAIGATLTWDADLFGRIRSVLAASRADAAAVALEYENALMSLRTKVAALYFTVRELEAERVLLEKTVATRAAETKFVADRLDVQAATQADLERARFQELSTRARLTELLENLELSKNLLSNLLGTTPAKLELSAEPLGGVPPEIPQAVPSELLERRADIAAAERAVCAANYRIGAAQAAFFPTVSITSSLGTESTAFSKLLNSSSFAWGVSPQVYIPIFQAGRLSSQKKVAIAKHGEAVEKYKSVVLKAVREAEDALAKVAFAKRRARESELAAVAAERADALVSEQYDAGVIDYFQRCQSHSAALEARLAAARALGDRYRAAVELVRALGGDWRKSAEGGSDKRNVLERALNTFEKSK